MPGDHGTRRVSQSAGHSNTSRVLGACYHRGNVTLAKCAKGEGFTTYTKPTIPGDAWLLHAATNCFDGHGCDTKKNCPGTPYSTSLSLKDCEAACLLSACTAVVMPAVAAGATVGDAMLLDSLIKATNAVSD